MGKKGKIVFSCIVSFVFSALFVASIYFVEGIYPGSDKIILVYDELNQYVGIWGYARYFLDNSTNFFYNWSICLGGNNISQLAYYTGNPINLLVVLFPITSIPTVIYFLTISKFAFAGLSFNIFIKLCRKEVANEYITIILSLCYSMMSYMVMYSMCLMWLDAVILLPLVMAGLEKAIERKKNGLFIFTLTCLFYTNFYIGYMIVLFSFLYFVWYEMRAENKKEEFLSDFLKYLRNGIISAMLAAPSLLPLVFGLYIGKGSETSSFSFKTTASIGEILKKVLSCQYDTIMSKGTPSLFIGTAVLLLAVLFVFDKKIQLKRKIVSLSIVIFLIMSMWIKPMYMVWHGFAEPVCFPARFAFVFSFFILVLSIEEIMSLQSVLYEKQESNIVRTIRKIVVPIVGLFTIAELWLNASYVLGWLRLEVDTATQQEFERVVTGTEEVLNQLPENEFSFNRIDGINGQGKNAAMLLGYNGISSFTSTYNNNVLNVLGKLGVYQHDYIVSATNCFPFMLDILSCKYFYAPNDIVDTAFLNMNQLFSGNDYNLYENANCLPIGFAVESNYDIQDKFSDNIFENINLLAKSMSGVSGILKENDIEICESIIENNDRKYDITIKAQTSGPCYIFFTGEDKEEKKNRKKRIMNEAVHPFLFQKEDYVKAIFSDSSFIDMSDIVKVAYFVGDMKENETKTFTIDANHRIGDLITYSIMPDAYAAVIKSLKECTLEPSATPGAIYSGNVVPDKDRLMFFSIPHIRGLKAYIDGNEVDIEKMYGAFCGLYFNEGQHYVEFYYYPPGLKVGILLCFAGLILCAGLARFEKSKEKMQDE